MKFDLAISMIVKVAQVTRSQYHLVHMEIQLYFAATDCYLLLINLDKFRVKKMSILAQNLNFVEIRASKIVEMAIFIPSSSMNQNSK